MKPYLRRARDLLASHESAAVPTALMVVLIAGFALLPVAEEANLRLLAVLAVVVSAVCLVVVARSSVGGVWSIPFVCLLVLIVFHLGALPEFLYADTASLVYIERFIHKPESATAAWISMLAILAFVLGVCVSSLRTDSARASGTGPAEDPLWPARLRRSFSLVGSALAVLAVAAWLGFAATEGLRPWTPYATYLEVKSAYPLQLLYYAMGLGLTLALVDYRTWPARAAAVSFVVFALIAFPLGLRGEVLFPLAISTTLVAMQTKMPRARILVIAAVVLLVPITVVSQTRQTDVDLGQVSFSPLGGLSELGYSLQVVSATVEWHDTLDESYDWGSTYWAPIEDAANRYLLFREVTPESQNDAHMSTQVASRVGGVGGSIVAEAYHNFTVLGSTVWLLLWGALLGWLNRRARSGGPWVVAAGIAGYVFLLLVRNTFVAVPTVLVLTAVATVTAAGLMWMTTRVQRRKTTRESASV